MLFEFDSRLMFSFNGFWKPSIMSKNNVYKIESLSGSEPSQDSSTIVVEEENVVPDLGDISFEGKGGWLVNPSPDK